MNQATQTPEHETLKASDPAYMYPEAIRQRARKNQLTLEKQLRIDERMVLLGQTELALASSERSHPAAYRTREGMPYDELRNKIDDSLRWQFEESLASDKMLYSAAGIRASNELEVNPNSSAPVSLERVAIRDSEGGVDFVMDCVQTVAIELLELIHRLDAAGLIPAIPTEAS